MAAGADALDAALHAALDAFERGPDYLQSEAGVAEGLSSASLHK